MGEHADSVMWPSTLPPCSVSIAWAQALQIAMAQQMDETWKQAAVEGFAFKEIDWTPTKPTHRKGGPPPTAMSFEPPEVET
jgi:hypothetical protein